MSRYRGPRIRILKRLGSLPGFGLNLNRKFSNQKKEYGSGDWSRTRTKKKKKKLPYTIRLKEKQKLRYHYGLTEKSLIQYVKKAKKQKKSTSKILLNNLEMRLDNIVFRLGFAPTLPAARQLITHGHVLLNGKKRDIPSSHCEVNDFISIREPNRSPAPSHYVCQKEMTISRRSPLPQSYSNIPSFLRFDSKSSIGKVVGRVNHGVHPRSRSHRRRNDIDLNVNALSVIEYYSR